MESMLSHLQEDGLKMNDVVLLWQLLWPRSVRWITKSVLGASLDVLAQHAAICRCMVSSLSLAWNGYRFTHLRSMAEKLLEEHASTTCAVAEASQWTEVFVFWLLRCMSSLLHSPTLRKGSERCCTNSLWCACQHPWKPIEWTGHQQVPPFIPSNEACFPSSVSWSSDK